MGDFSDYESAARAARSPVLRIPALGAAPLNGSGVPGAMISLTEQFQYQSYLSSTDLEKGVKVQRPSVQIVASVNKDVAGYALGLHPASDTPVAIRFKGKSGESGDSGVLTLVPGQIIRPHTGRFAGFEWGLPYGWLGGGIATVIVFTTPDTDVVWSGGQDVLFHRLRLPVVNAAGAAANWRIAWPIRFPWPNAYSQATTAPQGSQPALAVMPTRTLLRVRIPTEHDAVGSIRFYMRSTDVMDRDSSGAADSIGTADVTFTDVAVPQYVRYPIADTGITDPYALIEISDGPLVRLGGDSAQINLVDISAGQEFTGKYVDIFRYGKL